jgi:hypothetical protein
MEQDYKYIRQPYYCPLRVFLSTMLIHAFFFSFAHLSTELQKRMVAVPTLQDQGDQGQGGIACGS